MTPIITIIVNIIVVVILKAHASRMRPTQQYSYALYTSDNFCCTANVGETILPLCRRCCRRSQRRRCLYHRPLGRRPSMMIPPAHVVGYRSATMNTVNHKKRDIFFLTIALATLKRLL